MSTITARLGADLEHDAMLSLYRWVGDDRDLRDAVRASMAREPATGSMGPMETINIVVSNLIALGGLATSVAAWRSSRASKPDVTIVVNDISVRITGPTDEELRKLAEAAEAHGEDPGASG